MSVREEVIRMVEELPDSDLAVVKRMLQGLLLTNEAEEDPLRAFLENCPEDDEPYTEEEQRIDAERWEAYQRGEWVSQEEMMARQPQDRAV